MAECNIKKKGTAESDCPEVPVAIKSMAKSTRDFVITAADIDAGAATVLASLNAAVLEGDIDIFPDFQTLEDISQEAVYQDTIFSITPVKDGNYRFRPMIAKSLCLHKAMFTHRSKNARVFLIDDDGWWIGTKKTNGDFAGWDLDLLHTEKMRFNNGTEASVSPLMVAFKNNKEWDRYGMMVDLSQINAEIFRLVDVLITAPVGAPAITASEVVVQVHTECDDVPVEGLVAADFAVRDAAGDPVVLSGAPESATVPGRYTLQSAAAFSDGDFVTLSMATKPYQDAKDTADHFTFLVP